MSSTEREARHAQDSESIGYVGSRHKSKTKARCYYSIFLLMFAITILVNMLSFSLFLVVDIREEESIEGSFFGSCFLYLKGNSSADWSASAWACDVVLASKLAVLVVTVLISFVYYPILFCLGAKIVSPLRILDALVFFILVVLSCAGGVLQTVGLNTTCRDKDSSECSHQSVKSFSRISEYSSILLALVYAFFFICKAVVTFLYCVCADRKSGQETDPLLYAPSTQQPDAGPYTRSKYSDFKD